MEQDNLIEDEVIVARGLISPRRCEALIALSEEEGYGEAPLSTNRGPVHRPEVRNNMRVILDDDALAEELWEALQHLELPWADGAAPCGINERFRFYRYDPGHRFAEHHDASYVRPDGREASQFTVLIYLNEDFEGGETRIHDHELDVVPEVGLILIFRHDLLHEGVEVTSGRKYVLRTDLMYRLDGW